MQIVQSLTGLPGVVACQLNDVGATTVASSIQKSCAQHGPYTATLLAPPRIYSSCPECNRLRIEAEQREIAEASANARRAGWIARLGRAGIPERFMGRSLANFIVENDSQRQAKAFAQAYVDDMAQVLKTGRGAIFVGPPGVGKTHLAVAIGKQAMQPPHSADVLFITVQRAIRSIKDTWAKGSETSESQAIAAMVEPGLLILDEVGVQLGTDFEKNVLFDVLNERYQRRKPCILLSNLDRNEVAVYLGERVMDRMREDGGSVVPLDCESFRPQLAPKQEGGNA